MERNDFNAEMFDTADSLKNHGQTTFLDKEKTRENKFRPEDYEHVNNPPMPRNPGFVPNGDLQIKYTKLEVPLGYKPVVINTRGNNLVLLFEEPKECPKEQLPEPSPIKQSFWSRYSEKFIKYCQTVAQTRGYYGKLKALLLLRSELKAKKKQNNA